jgi:hypothetical protein
VYVHPAALVDFEGGLLACIEQARVDQRLLVDQHRTVAPVGRRDELQLPALLRRRKVLLLVGWRDPGPIGLEPDLQEMRETVLLRVVLRVLHPRAGGHPLHVPRPDGRAVSEAVLVAQRAGEDVADDLHVAMAMGAEPLARRDPVLVDHPQRTEAHVRGIVVAGKGKAVVGYEPAVIGMTALCAGAEFNHFVPRFESD